MNCVRQHKNTLSLADHASSPLPFSVPVSFCFSEENSSISSLLVLLYLRSSQFLSQPSCNHYIYILSLSQTFLNTTELKIFWSPPGIEPKTACLTHKHSVTELRQPASKQTLQFRIILLRGTDMLQSHSQQTNEKIYFFKDFIYPLNFFNPTGCHSPVAEHW